MTVTTIDRTVPGTEAQGHAELRGGGHGFDFAVHVRTEGRARVVTVRGELDIATVPLLLTVLGTVGDRFPTRVKLDLSGVSFVDCYALEALAAYRAGLPAGRRFTLRHPSTIVTRVITLTGLDAVFELAGPEPALVPALRRAS